jgi:hypothetical protein
MGGGEVRLRWTAAPVDTVNEPSEFLITCEAINASGMTLLRAVSLQYFILPYFITTADYLFVKSMFPLKICKI